MPGEPASPNWYRHNMQLKESIDEARSLTRQLWDALDTQDLEQWLELLDVRGLTMEQFEEAHRAAFEAERQQCRTELAEFQCEDQELRLKSENVLELLAGEFRELRGQHLPAGNEIDRDRYQACLDRKA